MSIFDFMSTGKKGKKEEVKAVSNGGDVLNPFNNFVMGNSEPYKSNFSAQELVAKNNG